MQSRSQSNRIPLQDSQYEKDTTSGALVNTDNNGLNAYKRQRDLMKRIAMLEKQVTTLFDMIGELRGKQKE